jgi:hypothetical protein
MRFYPDFVQPFPMEPGRERFEITRVSPTVGKGVVALCNVGIGDVVFAFAGTEVSDATQFSLQDSEGNHIHDPYFMGLVLHACDPNCIVDMKRRVFIARRPIVPHDLVTMDYEQTEDRLFRAFDCHCNSESCRGRIAGRLNRGTRVRA